MNRVALAAVLASIFLAACGTQPKLVPETMSADKRVMLILVGGNSEGGDAKNGIMKVYEGRDAFPSSELAQFFQNAGIPAARIQPYYFSWTGDREGHPGILPGHWSWITGGDEFIAESLRGTLASSRHDYQTVILGWSNGAATAYDLACGYHPTHPVDLLITLDPVSRTTAPCKTDRVATRWINVYTASGPGNRFRKSNIIAFLGGAWDDDQLRGRPDSLHFLPQADHNEVQRMLVEKVASDRLFADWSSQLPR